MSRSDAFDLGSSWATRLVSAKSGLALDLDHDRLPIEDAPFLVEYRTSAAQGQMLIDDLPNRPWTMWRYRELLPLAQFADRVDLGAGGTPLLRTECRILNAPDIWIKEESGNPTGSFKARGLSLAVNRARELGAPGVRLPSAGNAALAASAYAAAAGLPCRVAMPEQTPTTIVSRCRLYGAEVILEGRNLAESAVCLGDFSDDYWDLSTFKEAYRVEGKKTMALEILEQLSWEPPSWIIYPTGGGTGIVAMYKAFRELRELGILKQDFPRLVAVQMEGCAPIVEAFHAGSETVAAWSNPTTEVWGLRVPASVADFLVLEAIRSTNGTAVSVSEDGIGPMQQDAAARAGMLIGPEGAAALLGLEKLMKAEVIDRGDRVVVFQTGHPSNYV
jgi:threonine synthase